MASALSATVWTTSSTSVLATARIASRSSTSLRPISFSLVATDLLLPVAGRDGVHETIDELAPFGVARVGQAHGLHEQEAHAEGLAELGGGVDVDLGRHAAVAVAAGQHVGPERPELHEAFAQQRRPLRS